MPQTFEEILNEKIDYFKSKVLPSMELKKKYVINPKELNPFLSNLFEQMQAADSMWAQDIIDFETDPLYDLDPEVSLTLHKTKLMIGPEAVSLNNNSTEFNFHLKRILFKDHHFLVDIISELNSIDRQDLVHFSVLTFVDFILLGKLIEAKTKQPLIIQDDLSKSSTKELQVKRSEIELF